MKINNVNKKLIASLLAITLTMPVAGCSMKQETEYFDIGQTQQGYSTDKADNTVTYENIKDCEVLFMQYEDLPDFVNIYVAYNINGKYYNLFGANVIENVENEYAEKANLVDYLTKYNKIQTEYTESEVYELMRIIEAEYKAEHISSMDSSLEYFKMEQTEQGYNANNTVTYEGIKDCEVLFMRHEELEDFVNIYITHNINGKYYNIFGGNLVENAEQEYAEKAGLADYLTTYGKVQPEYTEDQLYEVVRLITADYQAQVANENVK